MGFQENDKIIMIGDSITDTGRRTDSEKIGNGYVRLVRDYYLTKYPDLNLNFVNQGFDGNRVTDLEARWEKDVLSLNPDWVSISIGINDVWRQLDRPEIEQVYPEKFLSVYSSLLSRLKESTNAKVILMEPTIIEEDIESRGNQLLTPYVEIVNHLADEFDCVIVPTHQAFRNYLASKSDYKLTTDGVHMNSIGNMLMASTWIDTVDNRNKEGVFVIREKK